MAHTQILQFRVQFSPLAPISGTHTIAPLSGRITISLTKSLNMSGNPQAQWTINLNQALLEERKREPPYCKMCHKNPAEYSGYCGNCYKKLEDNKKTKKVAKNRSHLFPARLSFILDNAIRRRFDPPQKVIEILGINESFSVMDFGCGPGFYTIPFAKVAKEVVAVDFQSRMLQKLSKKAWKEGVPIKCIQSDGKKIPLSDKSFDLIFLCAVHHEIDDKSSVLVELLRLLKEDGRIVIREKTKRGLFPLGPPIVKVEEIESRLKEAGFSIERIIGMKTGCFVFATPRR